VSSFNSVARQIKANINKKTNEALSITGCELGTITSTGLKLDSFKKEIKDYMVLDYLTINNTIDLPNQLRSLQAGDRVLVATMGSDFVVIGRLSNA
jgi:uncharacterized protein YebE (UPF0316 family)